MLYAGLAKIDTTPATAAPHRHPHAVRDLA